MRMHWSCFFTLQWASMPQAVLNGTSTLRTRYSNRHFCRMRLRYARRAVRTRKPTTGGILPRFSAWQP